MWASIDVLLFLSLWTLFPSFPIDVHCQRQLLHSYMFVMDSRTMILGISAATAIRSPGCESYWAIAIFFPRLFGAVERVERQDIAFVLIRLFQNKTG